MNAKSVHREARPHKPSGLRFKTQQKGKKVTVDNKTKQNTSPRPLSRNHAKKRIDYGRYLHCQPSVHSKGIKVESQLIVIGDGKSMCMGKVVVCCPKCQRQLQVTRPDSAHPFWSLDKPKEDEGVSKVVEQMLECKNSACASRFTVYWYDK